MGLEHLKHGFGVRQVIGRKFKRTARGQRSQEQVESLGVEDPALVVFGLGPGVGKVDMQFVCETAGKTGRQQVDRLTSKQREV